MGFYELFAQPTPAYRGKPFWAWNGKLDPNELKRQLGIFKQMGMGGAFLHSRVGLATEFLSAEWFDCIRQCVEECKRLGLEGWLYDEDRWPSGYSGGKVTHDPRYRGHLLKMSVMEPRDFIPRPGLLGVWMGRVEPGVVYDLAPLPKGRQPQAAEGLSVIVFEDIEQPLMSWFNGDTYLDTMSPEAVRQFIRISYASYNFHLGKDYGKTVPGVFTDEPSYLWFLYYFRLTQPNTALNPWTPKLPTFFKKRYGYDILKHLPELFFDIDGEELSQPRFHYRDCLTHLFVQSYAKQIGHWCANHNLSFTGHILSENTPRTQTVSVGSAQRFYEHMQVPGIDALTDGAFDEYDTLKQCASVVNQMGRKWLLSEMYGCTGWDFPMAGHKAIGDWQAALGVTLRCHHLSFYTMKGEAKRDYPASIHFQSPWWEHYHIVEDYFSRLHVALTQGRVVRRLLVITPLESMWARFRPPLNGVQQYAMFHDENPGIDELDGIMARMRRWLLEAQLDFDYGDEEMLARLGSVRHGSGRPTLTLGKAHYPVVLVPPQLTMRRSTLELLRKFRRAGGEVIFTRDVAGALDALASDEVRQFANHCLVAPFEREPIIKAVEGSARVIALQDAAGQEVPTVLYQYRNAKGRRIVFLCNTHRTQAIDPLLVRVEGKGEVVELDAFTGRRSLCPSTQAGEWLRFQTSLPPTGSALFEIVESAEEGLSCRPQWIEASRSSLDLDNDVQLTEENVLVLDRPRFRLGSGPLKGPLEILKIDQTLRGRLGLPLRGGEMVQPWARKNGKQSLPVHLCYSFTIEVPPNAPIHLVCEMPERLTIRLNGRELVDNKAGGWWIDPCLKKILLPPALLRLGKNELTMDLAFKEADDLEAVYLIGHFGVKVEGPAATIIQPVHSLTCGNWIEQGLPFYGGSVIYRFHATLAPQAEERIFLAVPEMNGSMARVFVNGKQAGFLPWPPYELDITEYARSGQVEIALEIIGSRRNTFGPLHQANKNPPAYGPENWVTRGADWSDDYCLKPVGLMKAPFLSHRRPVVD